MTPVQSSLLNAPKPIIPKEALNSFMDFDNLEIARQLTLMDHELFSLIKPRELINTNWLKEDKELKSPNLFNYLNWGRHVANWLVAEILSRDNAKQRIQVTEKIVSIGQVRNLHFISQLLEKLNNFSGLKMIINALQSPAIYQLKKNKEVSLV